VHALIVNGEERPQRLGLLADNTRELRRCGADAVTLGDHVYKGPRHLETLETRLQPIIRPANLSPAARASGSFALEAPVTAPAAPAYLCPVRARAVFMPMLADNPFDCIDASSRPSPSPTPS